MTEKTKIDLATTKRYIPWVVACALFMEQLDSTIVNTAVPSMATSLNVTPLSLKVIVASYILSFAVCIPISGWMADRFGTRRVFSSAIAMFTISSALCGLAVNLEMLVCTRIIQGISAAMMMPVGRLTILRTFPKSELLSAMNFVIIPALIGPLLGPAIGGLIVHWFSWRVIFFINVPVGLVAQFLIYRYMPNYYGDKSYPLDIKGLILFSSGTALLSWLLEIFNEHVLKLETTIFTLILALSLIATYIWYASKTPFPLLRLSLFKLRTFRISVFGGFLTRLGIGGMPFLLPLLYQLGLGLPAWQSGLLMMPSAIAAMGMKIFSTKVLSNFGYRKVLVINTIMIGITICAFSLISTGTPIILIILLSFAQGFFNSLQFSSINSMAYSDIETKDSSMASTIVSSLQQMSLSFGLAFGSLMTGWYLSDLPQSNHAALINALHYSFLTLGILTILSSLTFRALRPRDGESVSLAKLQEI